ncbi:MAG: hypothetical protein EPN38_09300 [Rhodanobacteraceae bacterium]|nr:MAG: hypothetical protein EPN38_09300 [Rhodanobacteraceae bacterium]
MRIPKPTPERIDWLYATLARLRRSMDDRRAKAMTWRSWYLHGAPEWGARYNMICPQLNTLAGYLYAPRSVRFSLNAGPVANKGRLALFETAALRLRTLWNESCADEVFSQQTLWSLVYGAGFAKFLWQHGRPKCVAVGAYDMGVWRDDLPTLEGQQAMLHVYRLDVETVREWLSAAGMGNLEAERWIARLGNGSTAEAPSRGAVAVGQMNPIGWAGGASQGVAGAVTDWGSVSADYGSDVPTLEVEEVWVKDDEAHDWRIFQIIEKDLILSDRANDYLPGHHPFVKITPDPIDEWFWGRSTVEQLIPLQALREKRMNQLDRLAARQANPPMVLSGFTGVNDEKAAAVMRRGGLLASSQVPGAKVDLLTPHVSEVSFAIINDIDQMFANTLGLTDMLQGNTSGERGGAHARAMMEAGAGRLTTRMQSIERAVADGATLLMESAKRNDDTVLMDDDGDRYVLGQVPSEATVEVAAHSASPLFASRATQEAAQLMEMGVIEKEDFLDLADPPMAASLKERLKARDKAHQKMVQDAIQQTPNNDRWQLFASLLGRGKKR